MVTGKKVKGSAATFPVGLLTGAVVSIVLTIFLAAVTAWIVLNGIMDTKLIGYFSMLILAIAATSGAAAAAGLIKHRKMIVCLLSGIIYYVILIAVNGLMFGCSCQGAGVMAILVFGGCTGVGTLAQRGKYTSGSKRKKHKYR